MSTFRPLPPRPSLEFEKKQAKALLRGLRGSDPEALARAAARHPAIPASPKLADAQLIIAREYGFASWPRLVRYFEDLERQRQSPQAVRSERRIPEEAVTSLLNGFLARRDGAGRAVAAFVRSTATPLACPAGWPAGDPRQCSGGIGHTSFFGAGMVNAESAVTH